MKQKLFLAAMAAIAMTSCSNDETLEINTGRAIDFRTAMATRATETTTGNLESFFVTAFNENKINAPYFENLEFTKDGEGFFTSEIKYYYPGDGSKLTFHAYAPSKTDLGGTLAVNSETKNLTLENFSPATDISKQVDFITANATGTKENEADGVSLTFFHRLSQIEIVGVDQNDGYKFKVKGIRIAQLASNGNFNFETSEWTDTKDKINYTYEFDDEIELSDADTKLMNESGNAMLIPQELTAWDVTTDKTNDNNGAYISLLMQITTEDGALVYPFGDNEEKEYAWAAIPVGTIWEAGKKYIYRLDFSTGAGYVDPEENAHQGEPILNGEVKFTVKVEEWEESKYNGDMSTGDIEEDLIPDEGDIEDPDWD